MTPGKGKKYVAAEVHLGLRVRSLLELSLRLPRIVCRLYWRGTLYVYPVIIMFSWTDLMSGCGKVRTMDGIDYLFIQPSGNP